MQSLKKTILALIKDDKSPNTALGIDISSSAIKFAEVSVSSREKIFLQQYHIEDLPDGAVSMGKIVDHLVVSDLVKRGIDTCSFSSKSNVSLVLPDSLVTIRDMFVPLNADKEAISARAESDVIQSSVGNIGDLAIDYALDPAYTHPDKKKYMLAITRKEYVDDRCAIAKAAGIVPRVVDIEFYAFHTMCSLFIDRKSFSDSKQKIYVFVDIGFSKMIFLFMRGENILFSKEQAFGVRSLKQEVQDAFSVDHAGAVRILRGGDEKPREDYTNRILPKFVDECAAVISRTLRAFFTSTSYAKVDEVVLSGGGSHLAGLQRAIKDQSELDISPAFLSVFSEEMVSPTVNYRSFCADSLRLTTVLGIAIRNSFNDSI